MIITCEAANICGYFAGLSSPSVVLTTTALRSSPRSQPAGQTRLPTFSTKSMSIASRSICVRAARTICASRWQAPCVMIWMLSPPAASMRSASAAVSTAPSITPSLKRPFRCLIVCSSNVVLPAPAELIILIVRRPRACSVCRISRATSSLAARMFCTMEIFAIRELLLRRLILARFDFHVENPQFRTGDDIRVPCLASGTLRNKVYHVKLFVAMPAARAVWHTLDHQVRPVEQRLHIGDHLEREGQGVVDNAAGLADLHAYGCDALCSTLLRVPGDALDDALGNSEFMHGCSIRLALHVAHTEIALHVAVLIRCYSGYNQKNQQQHFAKINRNHRAFPFSTGLFLSKVYHCSIRPSTILTAPASAACTGALSPTCISSYSPPLPSTRAKASTLTGS